MAHGKRVCETQCLVELARSLSWDLPTGLLFASCLAHLPCLKSLCRSTFCPIYWGALFKKRVATLFASVFLLLLSCSPKSGLYLGNFSCRWSIAKSLCSFGTFIAKPCGARCCWICFDCVFSNLALVKSWRVYGANIATIWLCFTRLLQGRNLISLLSCIPLEQITLKTRKSFECWDLRPLRLCPFCRIWRLNLVPHNFASE